MTVYIEYAFLQNFLLDGWLLWLAFKAGRLPARWGKILFAAAVGGAFAVIFPLLQLPSFLSFLLKWSVGALLPLLAFGRVRGKNGRKGYAVSAVAFLAFTFLFGGALSAQKPSSFFVTFLVFVVLTGLALLVCEKFYQRRKVFQNVCDCEVASGEKRVKIRGFLDSGNLVTKNGVPVCFLSADIIYELYGKEIAFGGGQVCDEMAITTLAGERRVPLYKGKIRIKGVEKEVYFALSANMIGREYKVLLHSALGESL